MRSLVFEGSTWEEYETLREKDKNLHKNLRKILKQLLRDDDPSEGYHGNSSLNSKEENSVN
jgi:toxin YoeB